MSGKRAVFLDKDGTLIENVPYCVDLSKVVFKRGVLAGLKELQEMGFLLVIITNQSGIARGYFSENQFLDYARGLETLLRAQGVSITQTYYCPHHPQGSVKRYAIECMCRKPKTQMILTASQYHRIDLTSSWLVGDSMSDIEAGKRSGLKSILLSDGRPNGAATDNYSAVDFAAAKQIILST